SRSMSRTLRLCSWASATPRFTVVVVFPTPPFCAVMAMMVAFLLPLARWVSDEAKRLRPSRSRFLMVDVGGSARARGAHMSEGARARTRGTVGVLSALRFVGACQRQFFDVGGG